MSDPGAPIPSLHAALEKSGAKIIPLKGRPVAAPLTVEEIVSRVLSVAADVMDDLADRIAKDVERCRDVSASHEQLARSLAQTEAVAREAARTLKP